MVSSATAFAFLAVLAVATVASASSCSCQCSAFAGEVLLHGDCSNCDSRCTTYCYPTGWYAISCTTTCFPGDATVELENGSTKTMSDLAVGDKVLVDANTYSEVYMFSHQDSEAVTSFVTITTSHNQTLKLTPDHYMYINGKLLTAKMAKVGDVVITRDGSEATIESVSTKRGHGLYNPHTLHGDIVVDGVKTSSYTAAVAPTLAHSLLWPVRMLYTMGYDIVNGVFEEGNDIIAAIAPRGRDAY